MMHHVKEIVLGIGDGVAYSVAYTTIVGILPPLAALASILWIGYQFYHSPPMQKRREAKEAAKAAIAAARVLNEEEKDGQD